MYIYVQTYVYINTSSIVYMYVEKRKTEILQIVHFTFF